MPTPAMSGLRNRRWTPTMLAISAARMSTASSPSRKTMIALFVTTAARDCGPLPIASADSLSARSSAAIVPASSSAVAFWRRSCARPS